MGFEPRFRHIAVSLLLGLALIAASLYYLSDALMFAALVVGLLFIVLSVFVVGWINNRERAVFYSSLTGFARELAALDPDQYGALGIRFPMLRLRWRGKPVLTVEDSDVTLEHFEIFMQDSNFQQIAPERIWNTSVRPRPVWMKLRSWLEKNEYIYRESAAGSHSWLWRGNAYHTLREHYLTSKMVELGAAPQPPVRHAVPVHEELEEAEAV